MNDWRWNLKTKLYRCVRISFPFNIILKRENKRLESILCDIEINNKKVVDLGTGTGNVLKYFSNSNLVLGIDLTFSMLQVTRQLYPGIKLIQADALKLPVKTDSVELITAIGLSEYLSDIESLFMEAHRLLKADGFLLLTFSPGGIWTSLRLLLGYPIYPRTLNELISIASSERFRLIKDTHSVMQVQVLFQKI